LGGDNKLIKQEEHQQRAATRRHVDSPRGEIVPLVWIVRRAGEAEVDVPAGIARIVGGRDSGNPRAQFRATVRRAPEGYRSGSWHDLRLHAVGGTPRRVDLDEFQDPLPDRRLRFVRSGADVGREDDVR
jgi:hypothetical protein